VEDGEVLPARVDGQVDREVADLDLLSGGPKFPLVGELDRTVAQEARQHTRHGGLTPARRPGGGFLGGLPAIEPGEEGKARAEADGQCGGGSRAHDEFPGQLAVIMGPGRVGGMKIW
jgi:hypothetical protein